jgi:DNA-binding NarL/FixJ family response regulator
MELRTNRFSGDEPAGGRIGLSENNAMASPAWDTTVPLGLTVREIDVLRLIGEGCSVTGIADMLGYSESTIKKVLHGAMRQVGARNRTQAVAIALRAKVI